MSVSPCIVAVPERISHVDRMLRKLPDVPVYWDHDHAGPVAGMCGAIAKALGQHTTHVLILEDDIHVCDDFLAGVEAAIAAKPQSPISYCWLGRESREQPPGTFIRDPGWWGTQAYSLPAVVAMNFLDWVRSPSGLRQVKAVIHSQPGYHAVNEARWLQASDVWLRFGLEIMDIPLIHTLPSLVQHGEPTRTTLGREIAGDEAEIRIAPWFIGENVSALTVDW